MKVYFIISGIKRIKRPLDNKVSAPKIITIVSVLMLTKPPINPKNSSIKECSMKTLGEMISVSIDKLRRSPTFVTVH